MKDPGTGGNKCTKDPGGGGGYPSFKDPGGGGV